MFEQIIKHFGSRAELARCMGVDRAAVTQWAKDGLPPWRAIEIEQMSAGKFKAVEIVGARSEQ